MKKIILYFKVLFHIKGILGNLNKDLEDTQVNMNSYQNSLSRCNSDIEFLQIAVTYLAKFALFQRNKPLYEIGQTVYYMPYGKAEKPDYETKIPVKITGIFASAVIKRKSTKEVGLIIPDYEYRYTGTIKTEEIDFSESQIIM